jgi:hypothetical protein
LLRKGGGGEGTSALRSSPFNGVKKMLVNSYTEKFSLAFCAHMATIPPMPAADVAANVPKRRAADKPAIVTDAAMKAQRLKPTVKVVAPSIVQIIAACV